MIQIALGILSSALLWLGVRYALSTAVVFDREGMRLVRGKREIWSLAPGEVAAWWRELGPPPQDALRAFVLRSTHGELRRIDVSWIGLRSEHFGHLVTELKRLRGVMEVRPVHVGGTMGSVHYILLALVAASLILIVAATIMAMAWP